MTKKLERFPLRIKGWRLASVTYNLKPQH